MSVIGATVMKIGTKEPQEVPQELDISLDLEYTGGCHMAIQVDLVFNKSVYLSIKMVSLRGRARVQLSRHPLTHWSFAFYEVCCHDVCLRQLYTFWDMSLWKLQGFQLMLTIQDPCGLGKQPPFLEVPFFQKKKNPGGLNEKVMFHFKPDQIVQKLLYLENNHCNLNK